MGLVPVKAVTFRPFGWCFVVAGGRFKSHSGPLFGFYENCGRSCFVAGCRSFYIAVRLVKLL